MSDRSNLLEACATGIANTASRILSSSQAKIALELRDNHNWTPLHHAVNTNAIDCVRILLSQITIKQIRAESWEGETALFVACKRPGVSIEIINMLLGKDAELLLYVNNEWVSPLQIATDMGRLDIVQVLLEYGAPINHLDSDEESALWYAIRNNNTELILFLVSVPECDLNHRNDRNLDVINLYLHLHFGARDWKYNEPIHKRMQDDLIIYTIIQLRADDSLRLNRIILSDMWKQFVHNHSCPDYRLDSFMQMFLYALKESYSDFNFRLNQTEDTVYRTNFVAAMKRIFVVLFEKNFVGFFIYKLSVSESRMDILLILFDIFQMNRDVFDSIFYELMADGYSWQTFEREFVGFLKLSLESNELSSINSLTEFTSYFVNFGLAPNILLQVDRLAWTQYCPANQFGYRIFRHCQQKPLFAYLPFITITKKCFVFHDFADDTDTVPTLQSLCREVIRYRLLSSRRGFNLTWLLKKCTVPNQIKDFLRYNYCKVKL